MHEEPSRPRRCLDTFAEVAARVEGVEPQPASPGARQLVDDRVADQCAESGCYRWLTQERRLPARPCSGRHRKPAQSVGPIGGNDGHEAILRVHCEELDSP